METKGMGRSRAMRHQDGAFSGSSDLPEGALKQASLHEKQTKLMDTSPTASLMELLQEFGVYQTVSLAILVAIPTVTTLVRGFHALSSGWHTRRKEFLDAYEKLKGESLDSLALETAVRHGFGIWIPAKVIQRIRALPSPGPCLHALADVLQFFEPGEDDGMLKIQAKFATSSRRKFQITLLFAGYFFSSIFSFSMWELSKKIDGALQTFVVALFCVICISMAIIFLIKLIDANKIKPFVNRYGALFPSDQVEASLRSETAKKRAWRQLSQVMVRRIRIAWQVAVSRLGYRDSQAVDVTAKAHHQAAESGREGEFKK
jgi:hypothetical protein